MADLNTELRARLDAVEAERDAARDEVLRLDRSLTAVRFAVDAAGIPDVEPYPDEPADDRERSLRAGGRVIAVQDRIRRLTAERDAAVRERDEAIRERAEEVKRGNILQDAALSFADKLDEARDELAAARSDAHIMGRCAEGFGPVLAELKAEHARELADARRSGLTLTAEERAALRYGMAAIGHQEARFPIGSARAEEWKTAHAAIDRLLAGARTVTVEQVREWAECNVNASGWDELEHALVAFLADLGIKVRP